MTKIAHCLFSFREQQHQGLLINCETKLSFSNYDSSLGGHDYTKSAFQASIMIKLTLIHEFDLIKLCKFHDFPTAYLCEHTVHKNQAKPFKPISTNIFS